MASMIRSLTNLNVTRRRYLQTLASVRGSTVPSLVNSTLTAYYESELLSKYAARPALISRQEQPQAHGGTACSGTGLVNMGRLDRLAWSYSELDRHAKAAAQGLITLGVKKGDRVAVLMGNNSAYACLQWACASIGAIFVTINPAYRPRELLATLRLVGASMLIFVPQIRTSNYFSVLAEAMPSLLLAPSMSGLSSIPELPTLRKLILVQNKGSCDVDDNFLKTAEATAIHRHTIDFRDILLWSPTSHETGFLNQMKNSLEKDDVINLQFTSGTTGNPKAVSLSHHNLLNNGLAIGRSMHISEKDSLCNVPPLFHCFDKYSCYFLTSSNLSLDTRLVLGNLAFFTHGAAVVYPSPSFSPEHIVDTLLDEQCTALHGVPTHFLGVLDEVSRRRESGEELEFSRLRTGIAAGSPIPIELMHRLINEINLTGLTNAYGMTETSPVSFQTNPSDTFIQRTTTVGKIHPHVRAKLVDPASGRIVERGQPGEVCIAGYLVQKGYWKDAAQTSAVMQQQNSFPPSDGYEDPNADVLPDTVWMRTGDMGVMDEDGYLKIVSRIKDLIIRGGENLFPIQIENRLAFHPHIHEAAVVAVPDDRLGEVVGVWVVRDGGAEGRKLSRKDVRLWVTAEMNPQNAPAYVWFMGEEGVPRELPKTASGKVQKHILRDWARDLKTKAVGVIH